METCGCTTKILMPYEIQFCSLHKAAPDLLKACKRANEALQDAGKFSYKADPYYEKGGEGYDANEECLAAIAKAEGK